MDSINSIILNNVEVQENGIIRNSSGYLIARLVSGVEFYSEHVAGSLDKITERPPSITTSRNTANKPKVWSRKGECPSCGVGGGSAHNKRCQLVYIKK